MSNHQHPEGLGDELSRLWVNTPGNPAQKHTAVYERGWSDALAAAVAMAEVAREDEPQPIQPESIGLGMRVRLVKPSGEVFEFIVTKAAPHYVASALVYWNRDTDGAWFLLSDPDGPPVEYVAVKNWGRGRHDDWERASENEKRAYRRNARNYLADLREVATVELVPDPPF